MNDEGVSDRHKHEDIIIFGLINVGLYKSLELVLFFTIRTILLSSYENIVLSYTGVTCH